MPFLPHYRAVIEGGWFNGSGAKIESWSTSLRIQSVQVGGDGLLNEEDYLDNELTDFCNRLFHTDIYDVTVKVDKLSFNRIGPTGRYADPSHSHFKVLTGTDRISGTGTGGPYLPPQCAVVATLRSDKDRGPGSHGRLFLPTPSLHIDAERKIQASEITTLRGYVKDALEHLDGTATGVPGIDFFPALASAKGSGSLDRVTRVGIGAVVDTVKSRRRSIPEGTSLVDLA